MRRSKNERTSDLASTTTCAAGQPHTLQRMAKHHGNKDEHQHDALMLNKTCTRTEQALLASNSHQLLALRAIKSKVHAPAQHQTTTSQSCTVPRLQHSLLLLQDVDSSPTSPAKWWHTTTNLLLPSSLLLRHTWRCNVALTVPITASKSARHRTNTTYSLKAVPAAWAT